MGAKPDPERIEVANPQIADATSSLQQRSSRLGVVCEGLLIRILPPPIEGNERGFVVAFASAHSGAGVTEVTRTLARALRHSTHQLAVSLSYRSLIHFRPSGWETEPCDDARNDWHTIHGLLANALDRLRRQHRYALIDCAPINDTQDAIRLAPLVDGIVLVVEANRTRKDQILYAERSIESANGRILGHVLNKRAYAVPDWLNRVMMTVGI
jgi:Mrp family chromosome partitioning ATPase